MSYYPTISATSFSIIESRIISKSSHIGINYLSSWKFQKFHIPLTVIQLTHTRIIHPSRIRLSYRLNRNSSRSNFIDRDVIIERKPNREKKSSFISITSNRLVENKRFERSVRKPLGRCITPYHLLRQWTNLKIPLFKVIGHARAGTRSLCTRCTLDRLLALPSIGQYFREGQGTYLAASVYFDKTVRPWTITTKEARSFDDVSRIGLIFVAE